MLSGQVVKGKGLVQTDLAAGPRSALAGCVTRTGCLASLRLQCSHSFQKYLLRTYLLCARPISKSWGYSNEHTDLMAYIWVGLTGNEQTEYVKHILREIVLTAKEKNKLEKGNRKYGVCTHV